MDSIFKDFIDSRKTISKEGMASGEREVLKVFYASNHGIGVNDILNRMDRENDKNKKRVNATARLLGFFDDELDLTEIGKVFRKPCSDRIRTLRNQYKKWHFPNNVNKRGGAELFDIYPYWIILQFLVLAKKDGIDSITRDEFMVFVATIRKKDEILENLKVLKFLREHPNQIDEFYSSIPSNEDLFHRFSKSGFHDLLSHCLEYIGYDTDEEIVYLANNDTEFLINQIQYFNNKYDRYTDYNNNTQYFNDFLSKNVIDSTLNIFPMPKDFSVASYEKVTNTIKNDYPYLNLLLKGVPGTGKSFHLEEIIDEELFKLKEGEEEDECLTTSRLKNENVIRVNIHSGLSNSELMQGIGVMTTASNEIKYYEKRGLLLKHIAKAILTPSLPYVILLEEVQENDLNRLIGDLIFLIENDRRVKFEDDYFEKIQGEIDFSFVSELVLENSGSNKVILPSLVEDSQEIHLSLPTNLFFFCTSNYRDDKKIMEDNLLRRFEVIDMFPDAKVIKDLKISSFLYQLNNNIIKEMNKRMEIHSDRYISGHVIWMDVNDVKSFYQALNKFTIDFKELKEVEWETFKEIMSNSMIALDDFTNYQSLLRELQLWYFKRDENDMQSQALLDSVKKILGHES